MLMDVYNAASSIAVAGSICVSTSAGGDVDAVDVLVVDCRTIWRDALAAALRSVWSNVNFCTMNPNGIVPASRAGEAAAAVVMGGAGLAANVELQRNVKNFRSAFQTTPFLLITDLVDAADVSAAVRAGAEGYLASDAALEVVVQSLRLLMIGGSAFPGVTHSCDANTTRGVRVERHATPVQPGVGASAIDLLTPKEREVLGGLGEGKPNKIIAYELGICETTVKVHMRHIMRKLGATNRTKAAILASEILAPINSANE
jgi:DNA-binding NarL/FixJ family response regulator